jgi:hypothetical protein
VDDLVRLEDVMPTCLEVCGLPVPEGLDARSLLGDLAGRISIGHLGPPLGESTVRVLLEAGITRGVATDSVSDGRFHYLGYSNGSHELFDLAVDPGEDRNAVDRYPEIVRKMVQLFPER